jgi:hypothetical protein
LRLTSGKVEFGLDLTDQQYVMAIVYVTGHANIDVDITSYMVPLNVCFTFKREYRSSVSVNEEDNVLVKIRFSAVSKVYRVNFDKYFNNALYESVTELIGGLWSFERSY